MACAGLRRTLQSPPLVHVAFTGSADGPRSSFFRDFMGPAHPDIVDSWRIIRGNQTGVCEPRTSCRQQAVLQLCKLDGGLRPRRMPDAKVTAMRFPFGKRDVSLQKKFIERTGETRFESDDGWQVRTVSDAGFRTGFSMTTRNSQVTPNTEGVEPERPDVRSKPLRLLASRFLYLQHGSSPGGCLLGQSAGPSNRPRHLI